MKNPLSPELLAAYRATTYRVPSLGLGLRVGEPSPPLDQFLISRNCACAAFLSAANPWSQCLPEEENQRRHELLRADLISAGFAPIEALGQPDSPEWPAEISFLVPGMDRASLDTFLHKWEQCAGLYLRPGHAPELALNSAIGS